MQTDELERQLRDALRRTLDRELGPEPTWTDAPAARRVAALDRRRRRWPLRVLAVAALIGAGGGAALLGGRLNPAPELAADATNGWIAFTVEQDDPAGVDPDADIWFVALDEEPRRVIGTDADSVDQLCPAFSSDGRSLAYGSVNRAGGIQPAAYQDAALVVADVNEDGTVADRLTVDVGDALPPPCPVWSPDGQRIAFGLPRTSPINPETSAAGSEVWVVTLEDGGITVLPDLLATDLEWSPDGKLLAIASGVDALIRGNVLHDGRIHLYEPSSGVTRSLDGTLGATSLTWSPDGGRIAYATIANGTGDSESELRVVDVESEEQQVLTATYGAIHGIGPVWSPDGQTIVYQRMMAAGGERHEVVMVAPDDRSAETGLAREVVIAPEETNEGPFPWRVTWSPDGRYLLYLAWSYPNSRCGEGTLVAVSTDLDGQCVVLTELDKIVAHDGYDYTTFVPVQIWGRDPFAGSRSSVSPSTEASASPTAQASAFHTASANASPVGDVFADWLDTSKWTTYVSERYGFTIGHPAAWTAIESTRDWEQETDSINWDSGGLETFVAPDDSIYLAAWSVDVEPSTTLAEWVQAFCDRYVASCTDIEGMTEPAFANGGDREGILFSWDDGIAAFFPTWYDDEAEPGSAWEQPAPTDGRIYIVESGRPDSGPYRARELIEAFSASLCIGCAT